VIWLLVFSAVVIGLMYVLLVGTDFDRRSR